MNAKLIMLSVVLLYACGCGGDHRSGPLNGDTLRVGTDATYPPFETVNTQTGKPEGFDIDLITAVARRNGWNVEFIVTPFDGMIAGLQNEKYDVAISAITITPERAAAVAFSEPYYTAGQIVAVPVTDTLIKSVDDLPGKRVGVQLGTTGEMMAQRLEETEVFSYDNIGAAFIDMANGNLDAVLNDYPTTQAYIHTHATAKTVGEILSREKYGIAVRKGETALLAAVDSALVEIRADGTYDKLHLKWFDTPPAK